MAIVHDPYKFLHGSHYIWRALFHGNTNLGLRERLSGILPTMSVDKTVTQPLMTRRNSILVPGSEMRRSHSRRTGRHRLRAYRSLSTYQRFRHGWHVQTNVLRLARLVNSKRKTWGRDIFSKSSSPTSTFRGGIRTHKQRDSCSRLCTSRRERVPVVFVRQVFDTGSCQTHFLPASGSQPRRCPVGNIKRNGVVSCPS